MAARVYDNSSHSPGGNIIQPHQILYIDSAGIATFKGTISLDFCPRYFHITASFGHLALTAKEVESSAVSLSQLSYYFPATVFTQGIRPNTTENFTQGIGSHTTEIFSQRIGTHTNDIF